MKAIILAAGQGERLRPLTENIPKCMVDFFGQSILERQIKIFRKCGISDISVVVGYCEDKINFQNITKFRNEQFMTTNMVESLFLAKDKLNDSVIVSYGDIVFEAEIIQKLMNSVHDISVVIDKNWKDYWKVRFENPLDDAESLIFDNDGLILDIGQKVKNIEEIQGQFIGLMKFQNDGIRDIKQFYEKTKKIALDGSNPLNPNVPFEKSFMTDFLQGLIHDDHKLNAVPVENGWLEIDSINDYNLYNEKFNNNTLSELINLKNL